MDHFIDATTWIELINTEELKKGMRIDQLDTYEQLLEWLEKLNLDDRIGYNLAVSMGQIEETDQKQLLQAIRQFRLQLREFADDRITFGNTGLSNWLERFNNWLLPIQGSWKLTEYVENASDGAGASDAADAAGAAVLARMAGMAGSTGGPPAMIRSVFVPRMLDSTVWTDLLHLFQWPFLASVIGFCCKGEWNRLKQCGSHECIQYFYDTSKNNARRWCRMDVCGNQAKARKHYQKIKQQ